MRSSAGHLFTAIDRANGDIGKLQILGSLPKIELGWYSYGSIEILPCPNRAI